MTIETLDPIPIVIFGNPNEIIAPTPHAVVGQEQSDKLPIWQGKGGVCFRSSKVISVRNQAVEADDPSLDAPRLPFGKLPLIEQREPAEKYKYY
mgnify:FL=1